jgi:hypothetical protein
MVEIGKNQKMALSYGGRNGQKLKNGTFLRR